MSPLASASERHARARPQAEQRNPKRLGLHNPQAWRCRDGRVIVLRPARAGDVTLAQRFFAELSPQSRYRRFFSARKLRREDLEYLTRFELDRHMSVVATVTQVGAEQLVGAAHCVRYALAANVDLALVVADAWQGLGLGEQLLTTLTRYAGAAGITEGTGSILASNAPMLSLARKLGAQVRSDTDDATLCRFSLALR